MLVRLSRAIKIERFSHFLIDVFEEYAHFKFATPLPAPTGPPLGASWGPPGRLLGLLGRWAPTALTCLEAILMRIYVSRAPFPVSRWHPADHFDAYLRESRPFGGFGWHPEDHFDAYLRESRPFSCLRVAPCIPF